MIRAFVLLCFLAGCTQSTELLKPREGADAAVFHDTIANAARDDGASRDRDANAVGDRGASADGGAPEMCTGDAKPQRGFCPTRIDVYGGINMQLAGCGGSELTPAPVESGYFSPGTPDYDGTVAGRLLARLTGDPDLEPLFGSTWTVRSCAGSGETLSQVTSSLAEDDCGPGSPNNAGQWLASCDIDPAPVLLFSAGMLDDACHGGGPDSGEPDDAATYVRHYARRMDGFLASRNPGLAIVGPLTEWTDAPPYTQDSQSGCQWQRPDWDELGLQHWSETRADGNDVEVVPDLHVDFRNHSKCCQILGGSCSTNWFNRDSKNPEVANCDGAQAIVDFWYSRLKMALLARDFRCP